VCAALACYSSASSCCVCNRRAAVAVSATAALAHATAAPRIGVCLQQERLLHNFFMYLLTYVIVQLIESTHTHTHTGAWLLDARGAPRLPPPLLRPFRCLLIPARLLRVHIRSSRCWLTASAISPPVSVSLLPLLPYMCASFSGCYSRVSTRDSRVSTETSYSPTSCLSASPTSYLSASLLYFLYVPLYLLYCCHSLLTLLPPYATYCIRVWVLMYLLYSTYFICLLTLLTLYVCWYAVYGESSRQLSMP
jgi:hypothetical protein